MSVRLRIICSVCLAIFIAIGIICKVIKCQEPDLTQSVPPQVSVYFQDKNTILLVSFDEFLTGCIRGILPHGENPSSESLSIIAAAMKTQMLYHIFNSDEKKSSNSFSADFVAGEIFPYTPDNGDLALNEKLRQAVQYAHPLTINGNLFDCKVCKISTGITEPYPHCPSVPLLCDIGVAGSISRYAFTTEEVLRKTCTSQAPADCGNWFTNAVYENTALLKSINFCSRELSGEELQSLFNLPSRAITIEYTDDLFYFSCKGCGENAGLSVNAAVFLAKSGYSAGEIAAFFYPEAEYKSAYID